jgi:hypothetical protein
MKKLRPWQYEELLRQQDGRCAICRTRPDRKQRLATDHSHKSGVVRGLLCSRCNLGVAFLENDLVGYRAVKYMRRARAIEGAPLNAPGAVRSDKPSAVRQRGCRTRNRYGYTLPEFLAMRFRPVDGRRSLERTDREYAMSQRVDELYHWEGRNVKEIAQQLGITKGWVTRLLQGDLRYNQEEYYRSCEINWPRCQPVRTQIRTWLAAEWDGGPNRNHKKACAEPV